MLYFINGSLIEILISPNSFMKMLNLSILDHIYMGWKNEKRAWAEMGIYFIQ